MSEPREAITRAHHAEWARVVAALTRRFGDLDIAEEAAAEAFATAVARWPTDGVPPNPGAWLTTTAKRKAIDRIRREDKREDKHMQAQLLYDDEPPEPPDTDAIEDGRLRLIFTCCHPALAMEVRVALTLRLVGGLTVTEIARAFLVSETAMGQRITRAKAKIKAARIPYRVPAAEDLPARVAGVLAVLFLVFNEGYLASGPDTDPVRPDLTAEAIRLARLIRTLLPADGEVAGLLALMLLTEARRPARLTASGELVTLDEQDRGAWDATLIAEGHQLVRERLAANATGVAPGRYQILAAINAVHTSARDIRDTDWSQVVALYDQLVRLDPSPIIALNRAIAVAELDGPEVALATIDRLADGLAGYHAYHATRADLLRRLGRGQPARAAYDRAIELAGNTAETAYLTRRRDQLARSRLTDSNICSSMTCMLDVAVRRLDGQTVVDLGRTPATARPPLPVHPALGALLPRGLGRGSTLSVSGSVTLLLALLGAGSAAGAWCALVGLPPISAEAALEQGIDLTRLAIVPAVDPASDSTWATAVGVLLDAVDIVAARPPPSLAPADARRLAARARSHDAVLISYGNVTWPGADVRLHALDGEWSGLDAGSGRLRQRRLTVRAVGRGQAARPRSATLLLPAAIGGIGLAPATRLTAIAG